MTWTTEQLFADISSDDVDFFNVAFARNATLCLLVLSLTYPTVHYILARFSTEYQHLKPAVQNTVLQHTVEALFFTISLPSTTYLFLSASFEEPYNYDENGGTLTFRLEAIGKFRALLTFMMMLTIMYCSELMLRYRKLNPLVLFHHMCTIMLALGCMIFPTAAFLKVNAALIYFANYEVLTFYGLVMKALLPFHRATPRMMMAGMLLFGVTRPVQLAWILIMLVGSWEDHVKWQVIFQLGSTLVIGLVQCMALKIHYKVWKRCLARQKTTDVGIDITKDADTFGDSA